MNGLRQQHSIRRCLAFALGAVVAMTGQVSLAQGATWPAKPVTWVVGFAPGGSTDALARVVATAAAAKLGQAVVVENRSGANGNLAAEAVARAAPDGHSQLVGTISNAINASLYKKLNYDFLADFEPIAMLASTTNVLVVNPSVLPVSSVEELIKYAQANPGKLSYASSGSGSSIHLSAELFKKQTQVHLVHIPYRGSAPAMNDLLSGQVQLMFDNLPSALPHIRSGRLRALGVTSTSRSAVAPDIPTIAESGLPGFSVDPWFALFAPKGVASAARARMAQAVDDALRSAEVRKQLLDLGLTPSNVSPAQARAYVSSEVTRWADVVKFSGASVE